MGLVIGSATPSPAPNPWAKVVLPAPRPPARRSTSPGRHTAAMAARQLAGLPGGGGHQDQVVGRGPPVGHRLRTSGHELHPSSCLARIRSARISATTTPPERRAAAGW